MSVAVVSFTLVHEVSEIVSNLEESGHVTIEWMTLNLLSFMVCYKSWEEPIVDGIDNVGEPRATQHVAGSVHRSVDVRYVPHVSWVVLDYVEDNVCVILVTVR